MWRNAEVYTGVYVKRQCVDCRRVKYKNNLNWIRIENMTFTLHKYLQNILHIWNNFFRSFFFFRLKAGFWIQARIQHNFLPVSQPASLPTLPIFRVGVWMSVRSFVSSFTLGYVCMRFLRVAIELLLIKFHSKKRWWWWSTRIQNGKIFELKMSWIGFSRWYFLIFMDILHTYIILNFGFVGLLFRSLSFKKNVKEINRNEKSRFKFDSMKSIKCQHK